MLHTMMRTTGVASRLLLVTLSMLTTAWALPPNKSGPVRAPSEFVAESLREALGAADPSRVAASNMSDEFVRWLAGVRVNPRLLNGLRSTSGKYWEIRSANESVKPGLGVLVLKYSNHDAAARMKTLLQHSRDYFYSKILTPFSTAQAGDYLVIVYSESSGDSRIIALLKAMPERFNNASAESTVWREQSVKGEP
jgi:hypothetical protein